MHLIWKRPDGFQNSYPEHFRRIALSNGGQLWLHKTELDWYPFQISGDWKGQDQTKHLNRLINLLDAPHSAWKHFIEHYFEDDFKDEDFESTKLHIFHWLESLETKASGNTWELEIIIQALHDIKYHLQTIQE